MNIINHKYLSYMIDESTLIIPDVEEEDEGIYTCEVITTLDMAEASGSITIVGRLLYNRPVLYNMAMSKPFYMSGSI